MATHGAEPGSEAVSQARAGQRAAASRLFDAGDHAAAAEAFAALAAGPHGRCDDAVNHAVALKRAGDASGALAALEGASARWPLDPAPHVRRGLWLQDAKDPSGAERAARDALRLAPDSRPALELLADILQGQGKHHEALGLRARVAQGVDDGPAWIALCAALHRAGKSAAAVAAGREASARAPQSAQAWFVLGAALEAQDEAHAALDCLTRALALQPALEGARIHLVQVLATLGRPRAGLARIDAWRGEGSRCASTDWKLAEARAAFLAGDMARGWEPYGARWTRTPPVWRKDGPPLWAGEDLAGLRVLVLAEQGAGDTLQFIRLAPRLKAAGARAVILAVGADLAGWLAHAPGVDEVVTDADGVAADVQTPLIDIARHFRLSLADCAARGPYLDPPADRAAPDEVRAAGDGVFKVALSWAGNPNHPDDRRRSAAAADFLGLAGLPGVKLFSVQRGGTTGADFAHGRLAPMITDLSPHLRDWRDTAAALAAMDAVACVDTGPGHAAGALGVPTFLLLSAQHDWRWQCGETRTPWYPNHRLIVQERAGDWGACIAQVREGLAAMAAARRAAPKAAA